MHFLATLSANYNNNYPIYFNVGSQCCIVAQHTMRWTYHKSNKQKLDMTMTHVPYKYVPGKHLIAPLNRMIVWTSVRLIGNDVRDSSSYMQQGYLQLGLVCANHYPDSG